MFDKILPKESWPSPIIWSYIFFLLILVSIVSKIPLSITITPYNTIVLSFIATVIIYITYLLSD